MVTWLSSLPAAALFVGGLVLALLVAIVGRVGARAFVPERERDHVHHVAAPMMPALGAVFAIFAALTLAGEANYLHTAETLVSDEAAASSRLAWASTSAGVDVSRSRPPSITTWSPRAQTSGGTRTREQAIQRPRTT
jgi:hypothetical protein